MPRLRGKGVGSGMVLGTAAVVRVQSGIPLTPAVPASLAQLAASRRYSEAPSVVLVAENYLHALAIAGALRWGEVVGIVASESSGVPLPSALKCVLGVPHLLDFISDDSLVLVDAQNGVVLVDPDPLEISQYQAEYEGIAPKNRFFLEEAHLHAKTQDGHNLHVLANVRYRDELESALTVGADGIVISRPESAGAGFFFAGDPPLLPANADDNTLRRNLLEAVEFAAGKPLLVSDDYTFPTAALREAAARGDLLILLPPRDDLPQWGLGEFREALEEAESLCIRKNTPNAMPRLGAEISALEWDTDLDRLVESLEAQGATRLLVRWEEMRSMESGAEWLLRLCTAASGQSLPVFVEMHLDSFAEEVARWLPLQVLLGLGAAGVVVSPEMVVETKSRVREMNASRCREAMIRFLQGGGA